MRQAVFQLEGLVGLLARHIQEQGTRTMDLLNRRRQLKNFEEGVPVFRRLPMHARLPKGIFPQPGARPYTVASQPTKTSLTLMDPATGELADKGARIPMDQIIARIPMA